MDFLTAETWQALLSLALGISLSAATGFRVFVPFLVMGVAANAGMLTLAPGWTWIGEPPALIILGTATLVEIIAYFVPWLDNALDTIATPAAAVAGAVATAAVVTGMSPVMTWTLAIIAGGGAAIAVQSATVLTRGLSSATTLGLGNGVVAVWELVSAVVLAIMAVVLPIASILLVVVLMVWAWRRFQSRRRQVSSASSTYPA